METIYQIVVRGKRECLDGDFVAYSQTVYRREPTEEDKNEFLKKCVLPIEDPLSLFNLDLNEPYDILTVELYLVD